MEYKKDGIFRIPYKIAFLLAGIALVVAVFMFRMTLTLSSQPSVTFNNVRYEKNSPDYEKALKTCQGIWIVLGVVDCVGGVILFLIGIRDFRKTTEIKIE